VAVRSIGGVPSVAACTGCDGRNSIDPGSGSNAWVAGPRSNQTYLVLKDGEAAGEAIDALLCQTPANARPPSPPDATTRLRERQRAAAAAAAVATARREAELASGYGAPTNKRPPAPGYVAIPELTDEFPGTELDTSKWVPTGHGWAGRQPGLFDPGNVVVADGSLQLWARAARRNDSWPAGYDNYTTSAVHSLALAHEGFFEVRWRSGSSGISSSWWMHLNSGGKIWTEIDMFETTGINSSAINSAVAGGVRRPRFGGSTDSHPLDEQLQDASRRMLPSHVHVFDYPNVTLAGLPDRCACKDHGSASAPEAPCSIPAYYSVPPGAAAFADDFHVASLNWTAGLIEVALDGVVVNKIRSPCLTQPIMMNFDRETMPGWMELPDPATLPDRPFEVDYVRAWRRG
jgi:hypothetical protein